MLPVFCCAQILCLWFYQTEECTTVSKLLEKICASYSKGAEATDDALNVCLLTPATPCRCYADLLDICRDALGTAAALTSKSHSPPSVSVYDSAHGGCVER